jgi:hypothetical protein
MSLYGSVGGTELNVVTVIGLSLTIQCQDIRQRAHWEIIHEQDRADGGGISF